MMQRVLVFLLFLAGALQIQAQAQSQPNSPTGATENALTSETLDSAQLEVVYRLSAQLPPGARVAIALIDGDETYYYGALREAEAVVPTDNQAEAFGIGSISKVFTGILLADAVREGRVMLTDSVAKAYDFPFADDIDFTYEQLATHTSGLPRLPNNMSGAILNPGDPYGSYTPKSLTDYLKDGLSVYQPGEVAYSNLGFGLLAYTLTHRLGQTTYAEALEEGVFAPLGLKHTSLGPDSTKASLAIGYAADGKPATYWHFTDAMAGAGAIVSTAEDMVTFLRAQMTDNEMLALARKTHFRISEEYSMGLGWAIMEIEKDAPLYWHNGGVGGYSTFIGINVEQQLGVVVLASTLMEGGEVDTAAFDLLKTLDHK